MLHELIQLVVEPCNACRRQAAGQKSKSLAGAGKRTLEELRAYVRRKRTLYRPVSPPGEVAGRQQPIAIERQQFDNAQPVQPNQATFYLLLCQRISADHVVDTPSVDDQERHQQQRRIGNECLLLLGRQLADQLALFCETIRQVGEFQSHQRQHFFHATERHVTLAEHAFDAGFAEVEFRGDIPVGQPALTKGLFQLVNECIRLRQRVRLR